MALVKIIPQNELGDIMSEPCVELNSLIDTDPATFCQEVLRASEPFDMESRSSPLF